jgi:hypothetical protein
MSLISQKWSSNYHVKPHGSKMVITIGKGFFSNFEKGPKTVQNGAKNAKNGKKIRKKIKKNDPRAQPLCEK